MSGDKGPLAAIHVPGHVVDVRSFVGRHAGRPLADCCLHETENATGRWVCLFDRGHKGRHGMTGAER